MSIGNYAECSIAIGRCAPCPGNADPDSGIGTDTESATDRGGMHAGSVQTDPLLNITID